MSQYDPSDADDDRIMKAIDLLKALSTYRSVELLEGLTVIIKDEIDERFEQGVAQGTKLDYNMTVLYYLLETVKDQAKLVDDLLFDMGRES